jgi:hypothetical protein
VPLFFICLVNNKTTAQTKGTRILFLMDASSSMTLNWHDSSTRFNAASRIVLSIIDSMYAINNEVEFAVRTYGTEYEAREKNCFDTKLEVDFNMQNVNQIKQKLKYVHPLGSSPIAYSLKEASNNELSNTDNYEYSFILITDGGETCGGDICDMYKKLVANKVKVVPYIIGLDSNSQLIAYYNCLGQFVKVTEPSDIANAVKLIVNNHRVLLDKPKVKNISTVFSDSKPLEKPKEIVEPIVVYKSNDFLSTKTILAYKENYTKPVLFKIAIPKLSLPKLNFEPEFNAQNVPELSIKETKVLASKNLKNPIFKKLNASKFILPSLTFEPEFTAQNVTELSIKETKVLASKNLKNPIFKKLNANKFVLPSLTFEPEFTAQNVPELSIKETKVLASKNLKNPIFKKLNISKFILPSLTFEPEFTAQNVPELSIKETKVLASKNLKNPIFKKLNISKIVLPNLNFEPDISMQALASLFPAQFRISFPPKSSDSVRTMRLKKLNIKPNDGINNLITKLKIAAKPKQKVKPEPDAPTPFTLESVASELSQIVVYFTDGNGKFYNTKPMVAIIDPNTKEQKQKFMRDVLRNGSPEPVDLKAFGTFDITVIGQKALLLKNVVLEKNKLNKVTIVVSQGTLQFAYKLKREEPVKFEARITKRWIAQPEFTYMKCDETKVYDPGEYYVEINTLPPKKLHTEISFGAITEIQLAMDGQVIFTNQEAIGDVTLFYEDGDKFADFLIVKVKGGGLSKPLFLQPGLYKAEFVPAGSPKYAAPIVVDFKIETEQTTMVELKNHKGLLITPTGIGIKKVIDVNSPTNINLR